MRDRHHRTRAAQRLVWINGALLVAAAVFALLYRWAAEGAPALFACAVRRRLGLYCPACGGSRAVMCLWRFDLVGALKYYPPVVLCLGLILALDVRLFLNLLYNTDRFTRTYRARTFLSVPVLIVVTWVVRTVCLLGFGVDLLGDFLP